MMTLNMDKAMMKLTLFQGLVEMNLGATYIEESLAHMK